MKKKIALFLSLLSYALIWSQECPDLTGPFNGDTNVPVDATITWEAIAGVPSYVISLGTTPGANDIIQRSIGSATSFTPPLGLPENTQIFVTITLDFIFGGPDIVCPSQSFTTVDVTTPPGCAQIRLPQDGATDVSVFTNILWDYVSTATAYDVFIGTTPGGSEVAIALDVVNLNFNPPGELAENTTFYVRIIPKNENGSAMNCTEFTFETGALAPLPGCTSMISPANGELNVPLTPLLEWNAVPGATGYRLTIGTTPTNNDIIDNAVFPTTSTFVIDFEPNRTFFITIVPFNASGDAIGCQQETFSTLLGCGPFLDQNTGEFVTLNPDVTLPSVFSFCENQDPIIITAPVGADGYRWYVIDEFDNETLLSEDTVISLNTTGSYYLEAYTNIVQIGGVIECPTILNFELVSSEIATIDNLIISDTSLGLRVEVEVNGIGDYEYAIDNIDGPYQDSPIFNDIEPGSRTVYVRDKNGCGIAEESFVQDLTVEGFPKFFTPNGDTINDTWQFIQPQEGDPIVLVSIQVFDRFGKLLSDFRQNSPGWDGNFNGRPMPSGGYWFKAVDDMNREVQGFFTLKR